VTFAPRPACLNPGVSTPVRPDPSVLAQQGRAQLLGALVCLLALSAAPSLVRVLRGDTSRLGVAALGLVLTAVVLYGVWSGNTIARYATTGLAVGGGFVVMLLAPLAFGLTLTALGLLLAGALFVLCGLIVGVHVPVQDYLAWKKAGRQPAGRQKDA
jgi:multisubunit Na+/H+ antiporter MnhF subunit